MLSITKTYKIWFALSGLAIAVSLALLFTWGLRGGIDFQGGSLSEYEFSGSINPGEIRHELETKGFSNITTQQVDEKTVIIKTGPLAEKKLEDFKSALRERFGEFQEKRFESIGPTIGRELLRKAYLQIVLVTAGIIFYIAYAFRHTGKNLKNSKLSSWQLGIAAVIALIHDLIITVGVFVVLGHYQSVEVDSLFVTALLTILGFSVHDTIVVFDRIRETVNLYPYKSLENLIDYSVNSTLARSINTSSTLIFVLLAMLLFGSEAVFYFVFALLVGVSVGTYSSIFIASPILYVWQKARIK